MSGSLTRAPTLVVALLALGACRAKGAERPEPDGEDEEPRWDRSFAFEANGEALVMAGPILRPRAAEEGAAFITRRCLALARGVPDIQTSIEDDSFFRDAENLFTDHFPAAAVLKHDLCREAFGKGWRLPTVAEASASLAPHSTHWAGRTLVARGEGDGRQSVVRDGDCRSRDPCAEPPTIRGVPLETSEVWCVAAPPLRPPAAAPRVEIRDCIERAERLLAAGAPRPSDLVAADEVDLVLDARRACAERDADAAPFARRLRAELGTVPIGTRTRQVIFELESIERRRDAAASALAALTPPLMVDCNEARYRHWRRCSDDALVPECVVTQVTFASACMNIDASAELARIVKELDRRRAVLEPIAHRYHTIERAILRVSTCPATSRPEGSLSAFAGGDFARPDRCVCTVTDVDGLLRALRDPRDCRHTLDPDERAAPAP